MRWFTKLPVRKGMVIIILLFSLASEQVEAEIHLSLPGHENHQGGNLNLHVEVTNVDSDSMTVHYPKEPAEVVHWLAHHAKDAELIRYNQERIPKLDLSRFEPLHRDQVNTLGRNEKVTFGFDLRRLFEFPPNEIGHYSLFLLNTTLQFDLGPHPNGIMSSMTLPSKWELSEGTEHLVTHHPAGAFALLARRFNGAFREIYKLSFRPTGIKGFRIDNVSWCRDGTLVVLSSFEGLHILSPGQAYYGSLRGSRGDIAKMQIDRVIGVGDLFLINDAVNEYADFSLNVSTTGQSGEETANQIYFRLVNYKTVAINEETFLETRRRVKEREESNERERTRQAVVETSAPILTLQEKERLRRRLLQKLTVEESEQK